MIEEIARQSAVLHCFPIYCLIDGWIDVERLSIEHFLVQHVSAGFKYTLRHTHSPWVLCASDASLIFSRIVECWRLNKKTILSSQNSPSEYGTHFVDAVSYANVALFERFFLITGECNSLISRYALCKFFYLLYRRFLKLGKVIYSRQFAYHSNRKKWSLTWASKLYRRQRCE